MSAVKVNLLRIEKDSIIFRTFEKLRTVPQNNEVHPEGSPWKTTALVWDAVRNDTGMYNPDEESPVLAAAAFFMTGKVITTQLDETIDRFEAPGHQLFSIEFADHIVPLIWPKVGMLAVRYLISSYEQFRTFDTMTGSQQTALLAESEDRAMTELCFEFTLAIEAAFKRYHMLIESGDTKQLDDTYRRFESFVKIVSNLELHLLRTGPRK